MEKIIVKQPIYKELLSKQEAKVFDKHSCYTIEPPGIRVIRNAFLTPQGLVLKNGFLVRGCHYNLCGDEDNTFYWPFWTRTLEQFLVSKFGKSLYSKKLPDNENNLIIHTKWFNYAFWMTDAVSRLIRAEEEGWLSKVKLIMPKSLLQHNYVRKVVDAFDVQILETSGDAFLDVPNLVMPETRKWTASFYPPHIQSVRQRLKFEADYRSTLAIVPKRIFLSREQRGVRSIINQDELWSFLKSYGFQKINFEECSVWDQIRLVADADVLIGMHGAGLANSMFMPIGGCLIEILEKDFFHYYNTLPFWKLASSVSVDYQPVISISDETGSAPIPKSRQSRFRMQLVNRQVKVDISKVEAVLNKLLL